MINGGNFGSSLLNSPNVRQVAQVSTVGSPNLTQVLGQTREVGRQRLRCYWMKILVIVYPFQSQSGLCYPTSQREEKR